MKRAVWTRTRVDWSAYCPCQLGEFLPSGFVSIKDGRPMTFHVPRRPRHPSLDLPWFKPYDRHRFHWRDEGRGFSEPTRTRAGGLRDHPVPLPAVFTCSECGEDVLVEPLTHDASAT